MPRTAPAPRADIQPPIDAIREAVRQEMHVQAEALTRLAAHAAAEAVTVARLRATRVVFEAIMAMLAVRLLLLLALIGGFALAVLALLNGSYQAGGVLVAYCILVVVPLVALERGGSRTTP